MASFLCRTMVRYCDGRDLGWELEEVAVESSVADYFGQTSSARYDAFDWSVGRSGRNIDPAGCLKLKTTVNEAAVFASSLLLRSRSF